MFDTSNRNECNVWSPVFCPNNTLKTKSERRLKDIFIANYAESATRSEDIASKPLHMITKSRQQQQNQNNKTLLFQRSIYASGMWEGFPTAGAGDHARSKLLNSWSRTGSQSGRGPCGFTCKLSKCYFRHVGPGVKPAAWSLPVEGSTQLFLQGAPGETWRIPDASSSSWRLVSSVGPLSRLVAFTRLGLSWV